MTSPQAPVLLVGGSGVVGSQAARALRRLQPQLPLAIAGRDVARAATIAGEVEPAISIATDLALPGLGLGLADGQPFSAVVVFLKDHALNAMRFAQARGIPFLSLSSGAFEIGPEVAQYVHAPHASAVLLASHWLAGAALFPTLHYAAGFQRVDGIRIGVLLDEHDMGGAAAWADYERITKVAPAALAVAGGQYVWRRIDEHGSRYTSVDGVVLDAQPYSPFDIASLGVATGAREVRLDLAYSVSASRRRGGAFSTEIVIEIEGETDTGAVEARRYELVHPEGQAPLTGLLVALGVERLLGLSGAAAPPPGLYFPELLLAPGDVVARMREFGTSFAGPAGVAA
ncbi:hypothetical protein QFW77_02955 [Luteimonas sp. RD2P54]|uniref:NAD(P)-dependent oxidoreductase n=1 Tax=Luteimonas endophytica TaxID=3042023 RepID=A0ABT6J6Z8_9GAMM|nr:hypothetical protein [Luteimonas endophytica]MDH5821953.1 hypothetical protein [Luteimonas endophytica]